jgi:indole-3-glycerol phosphate synthase
MSRLADILASKRAEIARGRGAARPVAPRRLDVAACLSRAPGEPLRLLAEVKPRSPSAGELSGAMTPAARAVAYAEGGASVVSVLCDGPFFGGSFENLEGARRALDAAGLSVPLLAKEFVLDAVQLDWAKDHGADAVLLIARIVSPTTLNDLVRAARARALEPLVEVTDDAERVAGVASGARVIGVNARDLDTLAVDQARAARVLATIPASHVAVHFSGVKTAEDVGRLGRSRADAALVGEALMREDDPAPLLRTLVLAAGRAPGDPRATGESR